MRARKKIISCQSPLAITGRSKCPDWEIVLVTKYDIHVAFWSYHLLNTYCCWTGKKQPICCYLIECSSNNEKGRGGGGEKKVAAESSQPCAERTMLECERNSLQLPLDRLRPTTYELLAPWQKNKPCTILLVQRIKPPQPASTHCFAPVPWCPWCFYFPVAKLGNRIWCISWVIYQPVTTFLQMVKVQLCISGHVWLIQV